jgi:acetylornithine deacetylase/succinyl-diaminopimelate desuccinylase-like protein
MMQDFWVGALCAAVAALVGAVALFWYCLGMPGRSYDGPLPQASREEDDLAARLKRHVVAVASAPHNIRHGDNLEQAARYIEDVLASEGYRVVPQSYDVTEWTVRNLEVAIEPRGNATPAKTIVIGAHYDSVLDAPGANDNGSGVAALIELARLLKDVRARRTRLLLAFFVNEEPPYFQTDDMGSLRYARMLAERKEPVSAMIALETIGYYSDAPGSQQYPPPFGAVFSDRANFIAFVGTPGSRRLVAEVTKSFRAHTDFPSVGGVAPGFTPGISWSDHGSFVEYGFQAMMITDTAVFRYPHYHQPTDTPDRLDYMRLARVTKGIERVVREMVE